MDDGSSFVEDETCVHPLSISHQFPFVASARLDTNPTTHHLQVGIDIVMMEPHNAKLYANEEEFINVFSSYFTKWEWSRIHATEEDKLNEFYIRWAMKEAYTKAKGMGMSMDFDSFDMRLVNYDNKVDDGIWSHIVPHPKGLYASGSVVFHPEGPDEAWEFFFLPLLVGNNNSICEEKGNVNGCVCICLGPFPSPSSRFRVNVQWTSLEQLVQWHCHDVTI